MEDIKPGYTRISSILAQWDKFGHIDKAVLENKAALGTRVHDAIKNVHSGIYTPLDDAANGYFESFLKWQKETKIEIVSSEERFYCDKLMITGQVDALAAIPGEEKFVLIDFKTSAQESPKMWPLQGGFYYYLASLSGKTLSTRILFVKLDKMGNLPSIYEYEFTKSLWNVCIAAWTCYRHLNS